MTAVDWARWGTCPVCDAKRGQPCLARSSGGPAALPAITTDRPHSSRRPIR